MPADPSPQRLDQRLVPLRRLGPSRFAAWRACKLREAFRAAVSSPILPRSPAAHLGSAIHRMLEAAAHSERLVPVDAEELFQQEVTAEEQQMRISGAGTRSVPLARSVRDFEVRRRRAIQAAVHVSGFVRPATGIRPATPTGNEVWIETPDYEAGGFVDEITSTNGQIAIRDFKTGLAARRGTAEQAEAFLQLKLYAAIYAEAFGVWPLTLEIVPLQGETSSVSVDPEECMTLLREARDLFHGTNEVIESDPLNAPMLLATPAPDTCRTCDFRPLCRQYLTTIRPHGGAWPRDVVGTLARRIPLKNGTLLLEIVEDSGESVRVRGVSLDKDRHPHLSLVESGSRVGVFSVDGWKDSLSYAEGPSTTIVVYQE
jgi:RecB family exonuclease